MHLDTDQEKPIVYSANGSHAVYAIPGTHDHTLQIINLATPGVINDYTDAGTLWDPVQNAYWYSWTALSGSTPASPVVPPLRNVNKYGTFIPYDSHTPVGWLYFAGRWGDFRYPKSDPRQDSLNILGFDVAWKYESGPDGPANKNLGRKNVWSTDKGLILEVLVP